MTIRNVIKSFHWETLKWAPTRNIPAIQIGNQTTLLIPFWWNKVHFNVSLPQSYLAVLKKNRSIRNQNMGRKFTVSTTEMIIENSYDKVSGLGSPFFVATLSVTVFWTTSWWKNFLGHLTQITLSTSTTVSIGDDIWSNKLLCVNKIAGHAKNKPAEPVLRW